MRRVIREGPALQLVQRYQRLIGSGRLRPGTELPSVRELARQEDVSVSTVVRAYKILRDEGWIVSQQGRGSVVADNPPERPTS